MIQPVQPSISTRSSPSPAHGALDGRLRDAVHLVKAEYLEMPGLGLTLPQVARFFSLTLQESAELIEVLVGEGLLICDERGTYRRRG